MREGNIGSAAPHPPLRGTLPQGEGITVVGVDVPDDTQHVTAAITIER